MSRLLLTCAAAALLSAVGHSARADELYRQSPINSFGGLSAQDARNPGGLGMMYEVVDNIDVQATWTITALEFWGGYARLLPGNMHGFMIRFYADNDGQVGPLVLTQDVMTFTEVVYYVYPGLNFPGYHYTLSLGTPFHPPAAGRYWMSITALLDFGGSNPDNVQWGLIQSLTVNPPPCRQSIFGGPFNPQSQDIAFVLIGTSGPSCGSSDFNCDGDSGTDADIEAFFSCVAGNCPSAPCPSTADFNGDGDVGTDADIEAFFRVLAGGTC